MTDERIEEIRIQIVREEIARSADASYAFYRWFIASLLLLNGAAILAVINPESSSEEILVNVGWKFAAGLFCALISGFFVVWGYSASAISLSESLWKGEIQKAESFVGHLEKVPGPGAVISIISALGLSLAAAGFFAFGCYEFAEIRFEEVKKVQSIKKSEALIPAP